MAVASPNVSRGATNCPKDACSAVPGAIIGEWAVPVRISPTPPPRVAITGTWRAMASMITCPNGSAVGGGMHQRGEPVHHPRGVVHPAEEVDLLREPEGLRQGVNFVGVPLIVEQRLPDDRKPGGWVGGGQLGGGSEKLALAFGGAEPVMQMPHPRQVRPPCRGTAQHRGLQRVGYDEVGPQVVEPAGEATQETTRIPDRPHQIGRFHQVVSAQAGGWARNQRAPVP